MLFMTLGAEALAETRYVVDIMYVPVRSGQSTSHRIIHKGLKSGTKVTLLEQGASGYSRIRTAGGMEGWMLSRYLTEEPSARLQLAQAKQAIDRLSAEGQPLRAEITALKENNTQLSQQITNLQNDNQSLQKELAEIRQISTNAIELDKNNKALTNQNQLRSNEIDVLKADIELLENRDHQEWFINGVIAVFVGGLLTLVLPRLFTRRKRPSEWA
jgi:SH3 domain protein